MDTPISQATFKQCIDRLRDLGFVGIHYHVTEVQQYWDVNDQQALEILDAVMHSKVVEKAIDIHMEDHCHITDVPFTDDNLADINIKHKW
jgi:hypothetical protein